MTDRHLRNCTTIFCFDILFYRRLIIVNVSGLPIFRLILEYFVCLSPKMESPFSNGFPVGYAENILAVKYRYHISRNL